MGEPSSPTASAAEALLRPLREDLQRWADAKGSVSLSDTDRAYGSLPKYARARYQIVGGQLWSVPASCVYRRDETTAWALLQLLARYPRLPDVDIVLNCRDGPLIPWRRRRRRSWHGVPVVLSYSTTSQHEEIAFPDYTLWGLPGKIKP